MTMGPLTFNIAPGPLEREAGIAYVHDVDLDGGQVLELGTRGRLMARAADRSEAGASNWLTIDARAILL